MKGGQLIIQRMNAIVICNCVIHVNALAVFDYVLQQCVQSLTKKNADNI